MTLLEDGESGCAPKDDEGGIMDVDMDDVANDAIVDEEMPDVEVEEEEKEFEREPEPEPEPVPVPEPEQEQEGVCAATAEAEENLAQDRPRSIKDEALASREGSAAGFEASFQDSDADNNNDGIIIADDNLPLQDELAQENDQQQGQLARDAYDLKLEQQEQEEGELPPNFEVPRQVEMPVTINGEPAGHQLLDTTKRIAKMLLRESWKSRIPPAAIDYRDRVRKVATQNNVNAIIAHVAAEEKNQGFGCRRCEDGKGPFTSCRVHPLWAPNGACTSCLHGGKNGHCSFVKQARAVKEARTEEEIVASAANKRAERVRELGDRFAGKSGPMQPRADMSREEAAVVAEEAMLWAEYMRLWSENLAEAEALSPRKKR